MKNLIVILVLFASSFLYSADPNEKPPVEMPVGKYVYDLNWTKNCNFINNGEIKPEYKESFDSSNGTELEITGRQIILKSDNKTTVYEYSELGKDARAVAVKIDKPIKYIVLVLVDGDRVGLEFGQFVTPWFSKKK